MQPPFSRTVPLWRLGWARSARCGAYRSGVLRSLLVGVPLWTRPFKESLGPFGSIGGSVRADWHPHAKGDDDSIHVNVRCANLSGTVPLDQLFELGLDRDSTLWLAWPRRDDRRKKGARSSGPSLRIDQFGLRKRSFMTADFFACWRETISGHPAGLPTIRQSLATHGGWLTREQQVKLRVLGVFRSHCPYGRDLRNGRGAFFGTTER